MRLTKLIAGLLVIGLLAGCGGSPAPTAADTATGLPAAVTLVAADPSTTPTPVPTTIATATLVPTTVPTMPPPTAAPSPSAVTAPPPSATIVPSPMVTTVSSPTATVPRAPSATPDTQVTTAPVVKPGPNGNVITIDEPKPGVTISSPLRISGSANYWPFEATLVAQLDDASGRMLALTPVMVQSSGPPQGGPWSEQLVFAAPAQEQDGTLKVYDTSAKDGSITTITTIKVHLKPGQAPETTLQVEAPAEGSMVTFPLHVALSGARGDEALNIRVLQNGAQPLVAPVRAELGFVVTTIPGPGQSGPATLEIARQDGTIRARRSVRIAAPAETQPVKVAWVGQDGGIVLAERRVPRTPQIGTAALNELLWGPEPGSPYTTSLPTPAEVLNYGGRQAGWGPRVRLLKLTINDGVALANFSPELRAYGGGSARVALIRQQIETTLRQFPSVKQVVIAVEGQTKGVLEP